jgi:membrane protein
MRASTLDGPAATDTQRVDVEHGRGADSPWRIPLAVWKDLFVRTWNESGKDEIALIAAGVAFYGFLALVPLLGAVVLGYGLFADPSDLARHMGTLASILPANAARLIGDILAHAMDASADKKGFGLAAALAIALFGARNGAGAIIRALTIAYEEEETRGFLEVTLLALAMTATAAIVAMVAVGAMALLADVRALLPELSDRVLELLRVVFYILAGLVAATAAAAAYRFGPARHEPRWQWLTPGSAFAGVGWLLLTLGFGLYVRTFGRYDAAYGSLGGVVALLTWLYLSSYVLLLGAELNSEVERQAGEVPVQEEMQGVQAAGDRANKDRNEPVARPVFVPPSQQEEPVPQERQDGAQSVFRKPLTLLALAAAGIFLLRRFVSRIRAVHRTSA